MTVIERLRDKANSLPYRPGVYIMKNSEGEVIYVGKSKKLKNRVSSYFVGQTHSYKTMKMVSLVRDFDYIVCNTEIEALTLENVLIKKYSPKYNIKLKDSKSYPYIKITNEEYPKLFVTRDRRSDKSKYFGPYQSAELAKAALEAVMRIFKLAGCKRSFPRDIGKDRPCIYKDMGRCIAPCAGGIEASEYRAIVRTAERVLDGNIKETKTLLSEEMNECSERMEFERAASIRDSIYALDRLSEKQKVVADAKVNRDVFALYITETESVLAMLSVRGGALVNKNEFFLEDGINPDGEDTIGLIADYYDTVGNVPREVMLDFQLGDEDLTLLSEYLSLGTKYKVSVRIPERGEGRALCDMALENAKESAKQRRLEGEREDKNLKSLARLLGLSELPRRIEAYDISNIGNENIVASMVVYADGKLKRGDFRSFRIKTTGGADDYGAMREALSRRLSHVGDGSLSLGECPDLILLDGGRGHVAAVKEILSEIGQDISLFGMVKDDFHKTRAITDTEREISIAHERGVYSFIYKLQEEAHNFALRMSSTAKRKSLTRSSLEKIHGIGEKKARLLLNAMPLAKIKNASVKELSEIAGISEANAESIYQHYHKKEGE